MRVKYTILLFVLISFYPSVVKAQNIALKNNLFIDATASVNLGLEFRTGERTTLLIPGSLNLWNFTEKRKFKHAATQPEFRWWVCEPFTGHFWGVHAHYAFYNVGGIGPFTALKNNRYEGWLLGAGVSYGYDWILGPRWTLEATVGVGYAYLDYDKYPCGKCEALTGSKTRHYFGPTKLGLTFVFLIK